MKLSLPSLTLAAAIGWTDAYVPKTPLHFASTVRPLAQIPSSLSLSLSHRGSNDDGHDNNDDGCTSRRKSRMERIRSFGQLLSERTDTFAAAGFYDDGELQEDFSSALEDPPPSKLSRRDWTIPLHAGVFKSGIQIAIAVWLFKKAKKLLKGDDNAVDDGVTTTSEQDATLNAWTCNQCGATLFVARGKEFRYFRKDHKCYICGNTGKENFTNTRDEIMERVGDDFGREGPWDTLTKTEKKNFLREAGGDEDIAKQLAIDEANLKAGVDVKAASTDDVAQVMEAAGEGEAAESGDDILEEVGVVADEESSSGDTEAPAEEAAAVEEQVSQEEASPPLQEPTASAPAPAPAPVPQPAAPKPAAPAPKKSTGVDYEDDIDVWDDL